MRLDDGVCAFCNEIGATLRCNAADGAEVALHHSCLAKCVAGRVAAHAQNRDGVIALSAAHHGEIALELFEIMRGKPVRLPERKPVSAPAASVVRAAELKPTCVHCGTSGGSALRTWRLSGRHPLVPIHDACIAAYANKTQADEMAESQQRAAEKAKERGERQRAELAQKREKVNSNG